jgi:hypothetical protein
MFGNRPSNIATRAFGAPSYGAEFGEGGTAPNNFIGILLTDLTFVDVDAKSIERAKLEYGTVGDSLFVVSFSEVPFWVTSDENLKQYQGSCTFQLVLNGHNNSITINYRNVEPGVARAYWRFPNTRIWSSGMECSIGEPGLAFRESVVKDSSDYQTKLADYYPRPNAVVQCKYPTDSTTLAIKDAEVVWLLNKDNNGQIVPLNSGEFPIRAAIRNSGTVDINNVSATLSVFSVGTPQAVQISEFRQSRSFNKIPVGEEIELNLNRTPFITDSAIWDKANRNIGFQLVVSSSEDEVAANNRIVNELILANILPQQEDYLGYDRFIAHPDTAFDFTTGSITDRHVGVYITPQTETVSDFYQITKLRYGIVITFNETVEDRINGIFNPDTLIGFHYEIWDDDGPNGEPGTLLDSGFVAPNPDQYYPVYDEADRTNMMYLVEFPVSKEVILKGGGFYLGYRVPSDQRGKLPYQDYLAADGLGVGSNTTEPGIPKCNRTFEINGNVWAPDRNRLLYEYVMHAYVRYGPVSIFNKDKENQFTANLYPNPAQNEATFSYTLSESNLVEFTICDLAGRPVLYQIAGKQVAGQHSFTLNTQSLPAGVYSYTIRAGKQAYSHKLMIAR